MENEPTIQVNNDSWHQRFMNHKLASVGIAAAVLLVATGIAFWQKETVVAPTKQPSSQEPHEVVNWKTYTNSQYGFEFKYPPTLSITEVTDQSELRCGESFNPLGCISVRLEFVDGSVFAYNRFPKYDIAGAETNTLVDGKELIIIQRDNEHVIRLDNNHKVDISFNNKGGDASYQLFKQILSTFKFREAEDVTTGWETYSNTSLGFSIQHPPNIRPTDESDDEYNRLTMFGSSFEVRLKADNFPDMGVIYGYLGAEITSTNIKLGGVTGYSAISETGYGDGGGQGRPYIEFGARHNGEVYHLIFYGDAILSAEESLILSTFKFTDSEDVTRDWKTYTNVEYGFEFKYPADYVIEKNPGENFVTFGIDNFQVVVYPSKLSLDVYINNQAQAHLISNYQKINFAGQSAYEGVDQGITNAYAIYLRNSEDIFRLVLKANNKDTLSQIKAGLTTEQNQILSTFKFTN